MSEAKDNGCDVIVIRGSVHFECEGEPCIFSWYSAYEDGCCDMNDGECMCTEAQTDALNQASGAINEELCRRANAVLTVEEEVERRI